VRREVAHIIVSTAPQGRAWDRLFRQP